MILFSNNLFLVQVCLNDNKISGIKDKIVEGAFFKDSDPILRGHTPLYIQIKGPGGLPDFTYGSGQRLLKDEEPYPVIVGKTVTKIHPSVQLGETLHLTLSLSGREASSTKPADELLTQ